MLKGILWDLIEKVSNQGIGFGISILLARLLSPEEFGLIGMVMVFVGVSQIFLDMGLGSALIQKQNVSSVHYSSVFYLNIAIGIFLTALLYICSPFIASFYQRPELSAICKGLSFLFVIDSLIIVQNVRFSRKLDFKKPAIIRVVATLISGGVGVLMAFQGFGVWSLVIQSLLAALIFVIGIWVVSDWKPSLEYDFAVIKDLWGFSSKLFLSGVLESVFSRIDILIIGKIFAANTLGFYTRAQSFNNLIVQYTSGSLAKVFFPAISKIQHDVDAVRSVYKQSITIISFLVFGLIGFFFLCAEEIFVLLFSAKWLPAVLYFKILMLGAYAYPLSSIMVGVLSGRGQSGKFLKLEVLKKVLFLFVLVVGFTFGVTGFLYSLLGFSFLAVLLNMYFVHKEIDYPTFSQIRLIMGYFILAAVAVGIVYFLKARLSSANFWFVFQAGGIFAALYVSLNFAFKTKAIKILLSKILAIKVKTI